MPWPEHRQVLAVAVVTVDADVRRVVAQHRGDSGLRLAQQRVVAVEVLDRSSCRGVGGSAVTVEGDHEHHRGARHDVEQVRIVGEGQLRARIMHDSRIDGSPCTLQLISTDGWLEIAAAVGRGFG